MKLPAWNKPVTLRLGIILVILMLAYFTFAVWFSDHNSCLRQQTPRAAGNARKAAIDKLVEKVGPNLNAADLKEVEDLTNAVPVVPKLQCNKVFPGNK